MPVTTIPLVGPFTTRTTDAWSNLSKDQRFINCLFTEATDPSAGSKSVYAEKRPGWAANSTPAAGSAGNAVCQTVFTLTRKIITVFGTSSLTVYLGTTSCGVLESTNPEVFITEVRINNVKYVIFSSDNAIFYLSEDAFAAGLTFTADRTSASVTLANVSSFSGLIVGQAISGTGIAAGARIASLNPGASSLDMTIAATSGAATSTTITREYIAKMMSANIPTSVCGQVIPMDGFLFTGTITARIHNSDLNSVTDWSANSFLPTSFSATVGASTQPFGIWRSRNFIVAIGSANIEWFQNNGNPSGSVLIRVPGSASNMGANSTRSVTQLNDDIYFVSSEASGTNGIFVIRGTEMQKVSDQTIDNILSSVTSTNASRLCSTFLNGTPVLLLTVKQSSAYSTFVFYPNKGTWSQWTGSIPWSIGNANSSFWNFTDSSLGHTVLFAVSDLLTDGKVYEMDMETPVYQDDGVAYSMIAQTQPYTLNKGKPFIVNHIDVICDTQASGSSTISASGDDYATFDTLGTIDLTSQLKRIQPGGRYESSAAFKIEDSGNQAWRGQALLVDWTPCT